MLPPTLSPHLLPHKLAHASGPHHLFVHATFSPHPPTNMLLAPIVALVDSPVHQCCRPPRARLAGFPCLLLRLCWLGIFDKSSLRRTLGMRNFQPPVGGVLNRTCGPTMLACTVCETGTWFRLDKATSAYSTSSAFLAAMLVAPLLCGMLLEER